MLTISNVPLADCPPSPPRTAPAALKVRYGSLYLLTQIYIYIHSKLPAKRLDMGKITDWKRYSVYFF